MVGTTEKVKRKGKKIIVSAGSGLYADNVDKLLTLKDTGNGYLARFKSYDSLVQDHYATLDYAQAEELYLALKEVFDGQ